MAKKFNLAEFVPSVSKSDTLEITPILWDRIRGNEANFYSVDDVEDLRNSIRMHGLLDPVTVIADAEPGFFRLVSGHRRHKAWGLLREEDPDKYAMIPAIVRDFGNPALAELALIMANSATRKLTPAEIGHQAERVERLLYDLKESGYEFDGRMRDQVAQACQVSASKLARLKVIRDGLYIGFKERWECGKLTEAQAYELARCPELLQDRIHRVAPDASAAGIAKVRALVASGTDYTAKDLTGPGCRRCTHGDAFLRHDLEDPWNPCEGKTCCLKCEKAKRSWNPCSRMCSKAKEKRAAANAKEKAAQAKKAEEKKNALRCQIREIALRLVRAADAAGVDDKTEIKLSGYGTRTVAWLRKAAGDDDLGYQFRNDLTSGNLDVAQTARALRCSADYVCGLTEELHPAAGKDPSPAAQDDSGEDEVYMAASRLISPEWMTGDPPGDGRYLCTVDLGTGFAEQTCDRRGGEWLAYGRPIADMFTVTRWWPLPAKWDRWAERQEEMRRQMEEEEG